MYQPPSYPIVQFLLRHGNAVAVAVAALPFVAALIAAAFDVSIWIVPVALVICVLIWLLLKSYFEVLAIIADTLLPK